MYVRDGKLTVDILPDLDLVHPQRCSQHCGCEVAAPSPQRCDGSCSTSRFTMSVFRPDVCT